MKRFWLYFSYVCLLVLAYLLEVTPHLFYFGFAKPLFILPTALAIAFFQPWFAAAAFGGFSGMLWDIASGRTGGYFTIPLAFATLFISSFFYKKKYSKPYVFLLISLAVTAFFLSADFFLNYVMYDYSGLLQIYTKGIIPSILYTNLTALLPFYAVASLKIDGVKGGDLSDV